MRPEDFWELTLSEFLLIRDGYLEKQKQDYIEKYNLNVLTAYHFNLFLREPKTNIQEYLISEEDLKDSHEEITEQDTQQLISLMHAIDFSEKAVQNAQK